MTGATVLRGLEGFGAKSRLRTAKFLRLCADLPVVVEIVDSRERVEAFLSQAEEHIREGLATMETVEIRFYRSGLQPPKERDSPPDPGRGRPCPHPSPAWRRPRLPSSVSRAQNG